MMNNAELLGAMSRRSLCISCFATVTARLERGALLALFEAGVDARVDKCAACKRTTRMTYTFDWTPLLTA